MQWYYAENDQHKGPFDDATFRTLINDGVVRPETLVWREGLDAWQPWERMAAAQQPSVPEGESSVVCAECNRRFLAEQTLQFGDIRICEQCKPIYFQKLREGAPMAGMLPYAGFWIRGAALLIDGVLLFPLNWLINWMVSMLVGAAPPPEQSLGIQVAAAGLPMLLNTAVACFYDTWFVGRFAATPGKMLIGLRIVRPDGGRVSYWRAFGRHFAEILSAYILLIGYLMAAFDDQKRSLHDRICDTRVIRKS